MRHNNNIERKALTVFAALFALMVILSAVDCCVTPPKDLVAAIPLRVARFASLIAIGWCIYRLRTARNDADRKMSQTLEGLSDAFFSLDGQWQFQYVNVAAEELLARRRDELLGKCLWEIYPDAVGSTFDTHYRLAVAEQTTVIFESFDVDRDKWFTLRAHPTTDGLAVFCHEITEAKAAEQKQREADEDRRREVAQLASIIAAQGDAEALAHDDPAVIMRAIAEHAAAITRADAGIVEVVEGDEIVCRAATESIADHVGAHVPVGGTLAAQCIESGTLLRNNHCSGANGRSGPSGQSGQDGKSHHDPITSSPHHAARDFRSAITCPLTHRGEVIAVLTVLAEKPGAFDEHDVTALQLTIGAMAASLGSATTVAALRKSEERLASAQRVARVGSWEYDVASGKIHWSAEHFRQVGRDPALGEPDYGTLLGFYHPADVGTIIDHVQRAVTGGVPYAADIRSAPDENGAVRWFHTIANPAVDETGSVVRLVGTSMDITERIAAQQAQERLTAILEATPDFVATALPDGTRLYLNRALRELLGIAAEQADDGVMETAHSAESLENLRTIAIPTAMRDGMWAGESTFLDRDGREVPVSQVILAHHDEAGVCLYLSTIARDISDSKEYARQMERGHLRLEEANEQLEAQKSELEATNAMLERLNGQLEALATTDCLTGLSNHRRFQEALRHEIDRAARTGASISVLLLDVDEFKAYNDTYGHPAGDTVLNMLGDILRAAARSSDLVSRYGGEEFAIIVTDSDPEGAMFAAERFRVAIESAPWPERRITASFGVATQSAVLNDPAALVALADSALYRSKNRGRNCVTHVSDQIGDQEMEQARLSPYADLLRTMQELQNNTLTAATETIKETLLQSYDATVASWARILALQDKETQSHIDRVADLIVQLARSAGMNEEEVLYSKWGALLHDIGKVAISDEILRKAGPLTGEEWEIVRRHPLTAYDMLAAIAFLRPALDIPCHHHEKWDGTGYPAGLRGDEIPFAARLFSIIDVYDALTSERPYRPAWSETEVREYLRSQSGAHFDPRAVAAFLAMLEESDARSTFAEPDLAAA